MSQTPTLSADTSPRDSQSVLYPDHNKIAETDNEAALPQILFSTEHPPSPAPIPHLATIHDDSFFTEASLRDMLELAKTKAEELNLEQVASDIGIWIQRHPWKAAFYAASAIMFFAPEILSIPALEALGFGFIGVRAGSMAAKIQSVIGPVAARSVFAIWQSARMGGYGVEYVNGGVRALVALADAATAGCNPLVDCKGLMNDGGKRLLEGLNVKIAAAVGCGWLAISNWVLG
ncbi:MAG: hypothetical protein Q9223_007266 [Gallowayella weberi]